MLEQKRLERFKLEFDEKTYQRKIAGIDVIIHCHHYNSRLHKVIEGAGQIDGRSIIRSSAESVFHDKITKVFQPEDSLDDKWELAAKLYSHLGYGVLDISSVKEGMIFSSSSHFVEGWRICFPEKEDPVCTFTEGYLQALIYSVTGNLVHVHEEECMIQGADKCRFVIDEARDTPIEKINERPISYPILHIQKVIDSNIEEQKVHEGLLQFPFYGDEQGLIAAFSVLLANTPADYYNVICTRYVEEMSRKGLLGTAKRMLIMSAEYCAMETFRGILNSPEWDGLIAPMVKEESDKIFGLISVINNLGWGLWGVKEHTPGETLTVFSQLSYEAHGYLKYRGYTDTPKCYCMTGVSSGLMQLVYSEGTMEERYASYSSEENECLVTHGDFCTIATEKT